MVLEFYNKKTVFIIRKMTPEDSMPASRLHAEHFNPAWSDASFYQFLHSAHILGWSAYTPGRPEQMLGFILLRLVTDEAEILTILTKKNSEERGIATNLLRNAMRNLHELQAKSLYLDVDENNHKAIKLYKKFKFKPISTRKAYYNNGAEQKRTNAIVMCYNFCYSNLQDLNN